MKALQGAWVILAAWVALGAGALAADEPAGPAGPKGVGMTRVIEKDTISVLADGMSEKERFALIFSRKAASISVWHDLYTDPKMEINLAGRGEGNGFALFQNRAEAIVDGKEITLFPGPAEEFILTESSDVRTIVTMKGHLTTPTGDYPGEDLAKEAAKASGHELKVPLRPAYETQFTVYPTGRVFIRHMVEIAKAPLVFTSNHMLLATAPADHVDAFNEYADKEQSFQLPSSYVVHSGTDRAFSASALLVVNRQKHPTDWLGQMMTMDEKRQGWVRSGFSVQTGKRLMQPGKYTWNFMLQIEPPDIRNREVAGVYVLDYLNPARVTFPTRQGSALLGDPQDEDMDGFAEGRGAYVVSADRKPLVEMQMDDGMYSRYCPAFEIHAWKFPVPPYIMVDGQRRNLGEHYQAHAENGTLVMQYLGMFSPGVHAVKVEAVAGIRGFEK